jgi:hypothetical protein
LASLALCSASPTRREVIEVRALVTVAEVTTSIRGIAAEVDFDHEGVALRSGSATPERTKHSRRGR